MTNQLKEKLLAYGTKAEPFTVHNHIRVTDLQDGEARVELTLQHLLGVGMAGHHQQAGGPPVQAVNGVKVPLFALLIVIIEQKIAYCIVKMAWSGVDCHPWRLIEYQQVLVLVHNVQRARGGDDAAAPLRVREADRQHLPRFGDVPGIDPAAVHQNPIFQPLDPPHYSTGQAQAALEQSVHLDPGQLWSDGQFQTAAHSFLDQRYMWNM